MIRMKITHIAILACETGLFFRAGIIGIFLD